MPLNELIKGVQPKDFLQNARILKSKIHLSIAYCILLSNETINKGVLDN